MKRIGNLTTYSVSGLAAYSDTNTGVAKALDQSNLSLEFVVKDGVSSFSYNSTTVVVGEPPLSTVNIDSQSILVNGLALGTSFNPDFVSVFMTTWRDAGGITRTSVILGYGEFDATVPGVPGTVNAEYIFVIDGDPLPHFTSTADWDTFNSSSVISIGNPTGAFAPGTNIALTGIGATVTEDDLVVGTNGADTLRGGIGDDFLRGGKSGDVMFGREGNDTLVGFGGADTLFGGKGKDKLFGYAGDDILKGGAGRDKLYGSHGYTDSESGNDILIGGAGSDKFIFQDMAGNDTIKDFDVDDLFEVVDLTAVTGLTGFKDLKNNHMSKSGSDVVIDDSNGTVITMLNVTKAELGIDDFVFS